MTGILFNQNVLSAKRVELLREIAPNVSRVALLMNPTNPNVVYLGGTADGQPTGPVIHAKLLQVTPPGNP